ncbi:hypothetical protein [Rhizobium sp. 18055]|uniref:hypothetical protein n=1 Tax=Rhizobium sp. 18055 TaxID=2681403 RepID=UPI00135B0179|nr:hypothetical protein [Rhizobium sp. 18055]
MSDTKHTQGEWKADISLTYGSKPRIGTDDKLICCVGNGENPVIAQDEWVANARLIAAAPDLLDSLQHLSNIYEQIWVQMSDGEMAIVRGAWEVADAAIAKATGGAA